MRRFMVIFGIALAAVVFASCGDDGGSTTAGADGQFNDADVTFTQGMIPHHEQAIEMSELALDPKAGASVKTKDVASKNQAGARPRDHDDARVVAGLGQGRNGCRHGGP